MYRTLLHRIRGAELDVALAFLPSGADLLEVGGGDGYQAGLLQQAGFRVRSIDISPPLSAPDGHRVTMYDGKTIPFADHSFDVVFSSNVLEHVEDLPAILAEIRRVLKPGGVTVHLVPSVSWRFWTTTLRPICLVRDVLTHVIERGNIGGGGQPLPPMTGRRGLGEHLCQVAGLAPHGASPSPVHELFAFQRSRWVHTLDKAGFTVEVACGSGIFYAGGALVPSASLHARMVLARFLGSACHVLVAGLPSQ